MSDEKSGIGDWNDLGEIVDSAVAEDPICPGCLGRLVADRSFGLQNWERGTALRTARALVADEPVDPPDPADCWVCEGHSSSVDTWAELVTDALDGLTFRTYQVGCRVPPILEENDRLLRELVGLAGDAGEPINRQLNREVGKLVGQETGATVDFDRPDVVALLELEREHVEVIVNPAFVYGRYRKLERDIPQTEWPCTDCGGSGRELGPKGERGCQGCDGTGYRYDRSVEQLTVPHVVEAMAGDEGLFHGAGREDVDARMLGNGRPFVIEVKESRNRYPDPSEIEATINECSAGSVEVDGMTLCTHRLVERVKELEADKSYRLELTFEQPVSTEAFQTAVRTLEGATIEQRTPHRVDHRRADRTRTRTVHEANGELTGERAATLDIRGEGGLYVKELAHGDDGRTEPSLAGQLGIQVTVDSLDVLSVTGSEPFAPEVERIEPRPSLSTGS